MKSNKGSRRQFLKSASGVAAGAIGFPYIVPASVLGKDGAVAPSNRIVMGGIGTGGKGQHNIGALIGDPRVEFVAVCDVDAGHLKQAVEGIKKANGKAGCKAYTDFQELVARKDIDAVTVSTPDHWHGLPTIAALNSGKDVYCEKPLTNTIAEGRAICDAAKKNNRIVQTGSQERSGNARVGCELVRNGRIGKVHTIEINLPFTDGHHKEILKQSAPQPEMPIPEGFDYNFWLGPAPREPYTERRCHFWWRFILDYGGGEMTDRGAHVIDIAQLGNGTDDTGPIEFKAKGSRPKTGIYDTFTEYDFECTYANGVKMVGGSRGRRGLKFIGDKGWLFIEIHGGKLEASDESILKEKIGPDELSLGRSPGHHKNFVDCMVSRKQPFAHAEIGHRTATICHLLNIAMITGRPITWDPKAERVTNDAEMDRMRARDMRAPWHL